MARRTHTVPRTGGPLRAAVCAVLLALLTVLSGPPAPDGAHRRAPAPLTAVDATAVPASSLPNPAAPDPGVPNAAVPAHSLPYAAVPDPGVPHPAVPAHSLPHAAGPDPSVPYADDVDSAVSTAATRNPRETAGERHAPPPVPAVAPRHPAEGPPPAARNPRSGPRPPSSERPVDRHGTRAPPSPPARAPHLFFP